MQTKLTSDRLITVDSLRGFALLGIMLAHFIFWYTAGPLPDNAYGKYNDLGSQIANVFNNLFITGKFFAFFSFLFGLSFYLQMRGLQHDPETFLRRYSWRLILLLIIGLAHHALWMGDILSIYAPLGFVLLMLRKMNNKWVLITGILLALNLPGKIIGIVQILNHTQQNFGDFATMAKTYNAVIDHGSLIDILKYNLNHLSTKFEFRVNSGRLFITLGFFLLGMFTGRKRWFENGIESKPVFKKICKRSALVMSIALACGLGMFAADALLKLGWQQNQYAGYIFMIFYDIFNAGMVIFFISGLTLLMYKKAGQTLFFPMAPVGKMALSSYITQTIFGLIVFYGIGFHLYTKTSPALNYLIAIVFFMCQLLFSKWWLRYFNYGPLEWLWRSGTLLKWQPMVKQKRDSIPLVIPTGDTVIIR
ncbi:MAG: DUF418 domain-containing protein [Segetibacter sp.]